jgi:transcription-repair coupling factor (superfamily II helicase)
VSGRRREPARRREGAPDDPVALVAHVRATKTFARFHGLLRGEASASAAQVGGCTGTLLPLLLAAAAAEQGTPPLLLLTPLDHDARDVARDLRLLGAPPPLLLRAGEEEAYARVRALAEFAGKTPWLVVASAAVALDPLPARAELGGRRLVLKTGGFGDEEDLARRFAEAGFERTAVVAEPGRFAVRGDLVDVFDHAAKAPLRIELFDGKIEGLRRFDPATQISVEVLREADVSLFDPQATPAGGSLAEHLAPGTVVLLREPLRYEQAEGVHLGLLAEDAREAARARARALRGYREIPVTRVRGGEDGLGLGSQVVAAEGVAFDSAIKTLERISRGKICTWIGFDGEAERVRFFEALGESDSPEAVEVGKRAIFSTDEPPSEGFHAPLLGYAVVAHHELFATVRVQKPAEDEPAPETRALDTFLDLREGDYVVHLVHGIAKFLRLERQERGGRAQDFLVLEFRDGVHVLVSATKIDLVQKYVGGRGDAPELSKIGSTSWRRKKEEVAEATAELAAELLELQAIRARAQGVAHPADTPWQREFEAAFPHRPTSCQLVALEAVKKDLEAPRPMDRLLCGDVGYGKTELAARAAFKVAAGGRQVAFLCPTTILAHQHWNTLRTRMADYPLTVECLSRFRTAAEIKRVVAGAGDGSVDVLIGTHRLLSDDVVFKNLGLLVVDEEQKFGVLHKEKLRRLKRQLDVLTLSATPIPRTLHQAMTGIRDISTLTEPPPGRRAVKTEVAEWRDELIRHAILRELDRGGQTFFVHNRVESIDKTAQRLKTLVPEARFVVGHGQMPERMLESVMRDFLERKADVLVATTIIESGLDIPSVNTVFVDRADLYGLAELHQLRGRTGRGATQAYSYFLVRPDAVPSEIAEKRLLAIEEFSRLGAGFQLALRDLEIRGAGNLLGSEQSGHIASVGYELYCRLLDAAVKRLRREDITSPEEVELFLDFEAFLPESYVADRRLRLEAYRKLGRARTEADFAALLAEWRDRFGPPPPEAAEVVDVAKVRAFLEREKIARLEVLKGEGLVLRARDLPRLVRRVRPSVATGRLVDGKGLVLVRRAPFGSPRELLAFLEAALGSGAEPPAGGGPPSAVARGPGGG